MDALIPAKAPNLQVPPQEYNYTQQQLLINQLKLYFSQLDPLNANVVEQLRSQSVLQWLG